MSVSYFYTDGKNVLDLRLNKICYGSIGEKIPENTKFIGAIYLPEISNYFLVLLKKFLNDYILNTSINEKYILTEKQNEEYNYFCKFSRSNILFGIALPVDKYSGKQIVSAFCLARMFEEYSKTRLTVDYVKIKDELKIAYNQRVHTIICSLLHTLYIDTNKYFKIPVNHWYPSNISIINTYNSLVYGKIRYDIGNYKEETDNSVTNLLSFFAHQQYMLKKHKQNFMKYPRYSGYTDDLLNIIKNNIYNSSEKFKDVLFKHNDIIKNNINRERTEYNFMEVLNSLNKIYGALRNENVWR